MIRVLLSLLLFLSICTPTAASVTGSDSVKQIYLFPIREEIAPSVTRIVDKCLREAERRHADYIVIDLNTYGGLVDAADSIRTRILNSRLPVMVFINNQAASAGALISLAADSIYMRPGATIGAATVVNQNGEAMPDKYQSFMRAMMRATAESHGKRAQIENGDTTWVWIRDPNIAEAMVDPRVTIPGVIDSTRVLSLTAEEAIRQGYSEGSVSSVEKLLEKAGITSYEIYEYTPTLLDRLIGFLSHPAFQGFMILLIIGGLYFELQTPGVGFPLIAAITGALLYFAPLYLEGVLAYWEIILFLAGVILLAIEIFAIPGFGVTGIFGIVAIVLGLIFAVIDNDLLRYIPTGELSPGIVLVPFFTVIISVTVALLLSLWLGRRILVGRSTLQQSLVLSQKMHPEEGYLSHPETDNLKGKTGVSTVPLRPSGKVRIDGRIYEAAAENAMFIDRGKPVEIVRQEGGVVYCREIGQK